MLFCFQTAVRTVARRSFSTSRWAAAQQVTYSAVKSNLKKKKLGRLDTSRERYVGTRERIHVDRQFSLALLSPFSIRHFSDL